MNRKKKHTFAYLFLINLASVCLVVQASAQSLKLSKNADFSTNDGIFSFSDILHAKVTAPSIDFFDIKNNEFRLKPDTTADNNDVEGAFTNNLNGTYEAYIPLSNLDRSFTSWEFRAKIKDDQDNEFESSIKITIQGTPGVGDSLSLTARIDSIGTNFFELSGKTIFVDNSTVILENGAPLPFNALKKNWQISVTAERRNDGLFWALSIDVLARDNSDQDVKTDGIVASVDSASIIVNNIKFIVVSSTVIRDRNKNPISLSAVLVGMLVEAKGKLNSDGDVIAKKIEIEDDQIGSDEFVLIGHIESIDSSNSQKFITVYNTRFEVDNNTELVGFDGEKIKFSNLRLGELVEVKARTRNGLPPLAERIKRKDENDADIEVEGVILAIVDSSITVGQFTFRITTSTIILDADNNFIALSDLRTGLVVEVHANVGENNTFIATRIKVEDVEANEIEVKGFIDALTDSSLTVSGSTFLVDDSTEVLDDDGVASNFEALKIGMFIEIHGEVSFTGTLRAKQIKIEDFLQDEIEIRSAITAIGNDTLYVTGITFFVDAGTQITGNDGLPIDFASLTVGTIVEIRANLQDGKWMASRIHIEDRIDAVVEVRGKIESLLNGSFLTYSHRVVVTNATLFFDNQNQPSSFAALAIGDFVEVKAQLLPDSSLVALRVKKEDNGGDEIELTGGISAFGANSITVSGATFAVDANTEIFDNNQQSITFQDLHQGEVVQVKAQRQGDGTLLAVRIKMEDRRAITGFITTASPGLVAVQGIVHNLTEKSVLSDARNQPINAQALKANQLVQIVARANQSQQEVVTLRVIFDKTATSAPHEQPLFPNTFSLLQNYPNPFNPSTVIRFSLTHNSQARLTVYDILGRRIRTLLDGVRTAGEHELIWDSRDDFGNLVASGIYFYRLEANGLSKTRKLTLAR